jgi:hypothetical protein
MGLGDKVVEWLKENATLNQRVEQLTIETRALGARVQNINDRLIQVETALRISELLAGRPGSILPPTQK